jgi:nucleobase:cation symporter-1, NCS1 family
VVTIAAPETVARPTRVEAGGIEAIPAESRHGSPWQLLATWTAPNLEFATIYVGVIAVLFFNLNFLWAMAAIILGNALGSLTQGILSTWGPREGLAQLVLSRTGFGFLGNILPAGLNTIMAGLGWFATNSISGAFALSTLTGMSTWLALLIIVVLEVALAFVGHDLVQVFERYATVVLGIIFLIAVIVILAKADYGYTPKSGAFSFAGFTLTVSAAFGYAAGWNPYASDYTRYLPKHTSRAAIGWAAGIGDFVSCTVLMAAGAAAVTIGNFTFTGNPTDEFTSSLPTVIRDLTLIAIAIGAIAANALNIYSGAMSFLAAGVKIPFTLRRAIVAIGFGVLGFIVALWALPDAGENYENFLLVIAYWIAPWLGVVFADRIIRRGTSIAEFVTDNPRYRNWTGLVAFVIAAVVSVWLFSNQTFYTGPIAKTGVGDLTPLVGFVVAFVLYFALFRAFGTQLGGPLAAEPDRIVGVDAADEVA